MSPSVIVRGLVGFGDGPDILAQECIADIVEQIRKKMQVTIYDTNGDALGEGEVLDIAPSDGGDLKADVTVRVPAQTVGSSWLDRGLSVGYTVEGLALKRGRKA